MSRPLRIQAAGLAYHVVARGNNKMTIFLDALDYARFLRIYGNAIERFALDSWVLCVMPNHYHLVFRTRHANLSLAIRYLNGEYARWWNRRHTHVGHVFQGRFKAQIIEHGVYLLRVCRYVLLNPVRAKLVEHAGAWKWSSYKYIATDAVSDLVNVPSLLVALDPDEDPGTRMRLLNFVEGASDSGIREFIRSDRRVIGTDAFAARFRPQAREASEEVPERERRIGTPSIVALLTAALERGSTIAAGVLTAQAAGYSVPQIAQVSGLSERTVERIVNAGRQSGNQSGTRAGDLVDLAPKRGGP
jgi:REP-associated tyrosine transposase